MNWAGFRKRTFVGSSSGSGRSETSQGLAAARSSRPMNVTGYGRGFIGLFIRSMIPSGPSKSSRSGTEAKSIEVRNKDWQNPCSEIARQVKTSAGTTQRELNRLLAQDFISFKKRGNLSIYRLNESYPLLREIEAIVRKTFGIEAELRNELGKMKGVNFAFLFGSFVEGSFKSDSDAE